MKLKKEDRKRAKKLSAVHTRLLEAFGEPQWHEYLPPVDELVCTILSQNTNDINRDKAFRELKETYQSWEEVRDADPQELQEVIRIAGLAAQKGPNIQSALQAISQERGEISLDWLREKSVDEAREWLVSLKGVVLKLPRSCSSSRWICRLFRLTRMFTESVAGSDCDRLS